MKKLSAKILLIIFFSALSYTSFAQLPNLDSLLKVISKEKSDSAKFYLAFSGLTESETNPVDDMANAEVFLVYGQKNNDKVCEVMGLACLGYDYRAFGNTAKSVEYNLKAKQVAESTGDNRLISPVYIGLATNYLDLGDLPKAIDYCRLSLERATHVEENIFTIMTNLTMGEIYFAAGKLDSALIFTQKAYELSIALKIDYYLCGVYEQLGLIQAKLNNPSLALNYFNLALQEGKKINSPKYINKAYYAIAEHFLNANQKDSAITYSKNAIAAVDNTPFSTMKMKPAKLLLDMYRTNNADSAFKYSEIYRIANDSLYNIKGIQQTQLMTFEEDARQKQAEIALTKEKEQRKQNIQYALIALGIVIFIMVFLLLSRSIITNTRIIEFLGVLALIVVFEFLNLLLSPVIGNITNHSPVLMLLSLVIIAAVLIPIHSRLQILATTKLVEKNKKMRLENAKRTIEKLEGLSGKS